jgi:hypothetical protein
VVDGSNGNTLYNNILINHHSFRGSIAIDAASSSGFVSDYNILVNRLSNDDGNSNMTLSQWQSLGYDIHSMIADPESQIFVDYLNGNYRLLQNAQAVDAGTNLVLPIVFEDLDNIPRPQGSGFDIGCYEYSSISSIAEDYLPKGFKLYQNYPNPFNPITNIGFRISNFEFVSLKVYDVLGNEVATLVDEYKPAGIYELTCYANDFPTGVYIYQLIVEKYVQTRKMVILK